LTLLVCVAFLATSGTPASAGFVQTVIDGGFEQNRCPTNAASCTNPNWTKFGDFAFPCREGKCRGTARSGVGWARLGGVPVAVGVHASSGVYQENEKAYDGYTKTLSFDLKRGTAVPGVDATFTANMLGGSGGICCLYQAAPSPFAPVWEHEEFTGLDGGLESVTFSLDCHNTNATGPPSLCPAFDIDNVSVIADVPVIQIVTHPRRRTTKRSASFTFTDDAPTHATYECNLDGGPFTGCSSPRFLRVRRGPHIFRVRAVGAEIPVAASFRWVVVQP
jgi:hypothetical protein